MRDHRKLVIYDVDEANPNRGAVFVMGIGIGDVYSSVTWEDRGFRVRGPATLDARDGLRQALRLNGFSESDIPAPLRSVASKKAQEEKANLGEFVGGALLVHNEVGFGNKRSSIARAMLYNLAQPGAVIIVPDQLWLSETWAGMLAGAAARGARVQIIAPALANAPIPDAPAMARAHDVLIRMLVLRDSLTPAIRESGGELHIGLFAAHGASRRRGRPPARGTRGPRALSVDPRGDSVRRQDAGRVRPRRARHREAGRPRRDAPRQRTNATCAAAASQDAGDRATECDRGVAAPAGLGRHAGGRDAGAVERRP